VIQGKAITATGQAQPRLGCKADYLWPGGCMRPPRCLCPRSPYLWRALAAIG